MIQGLSNRPGMDRRTETDLWKDQTRRPDAGLSERAGQLQQQVGTMKHNYEILLCVFDLFKNIYFLHP